MIPKSSRLREATHSRIFLCGILLLCCSSACHRSLADSFIEKKINAFASSDIVFPRSVSNAPFLPLAVLSARSYGEAQVEFGDSGESIAYTQDGISAAGAVPFLASSRDLLIAGAYLNQVNFSTDEPLIDDFRVRSVGLPIGWLHQVDPQWQAAAFAMPLWHDNNQFDGARSDQLMAGAFARYTKNDHLWWMFGVFGDRNDLDTYFLPYVGASWVINPQWTISAIMPWPSIDYAPNRDWLFSLGASPSSAAWSVRPSSEDVAVSLDAWDFGLDVERRVSGNLWVAARAGIGGLRGVRYSTRDNKLEGADIDVGASGFISLSLRFRPGS